MSISRSEILRKKRRRRRREEVEKNLDAHCQKQ